MIGLMRSKLRFAPYVVIALLMAAVVWRSHQLEQSRVALKNEQLWRTEISNTLGAPSDAKTVVTAAARAIVESKKNQAVALERIDREAKASKARADVADRELARVQQTNQRKFAAALDRIRELEARKPTGDVGRDQVLIDQDSKAAWSNWR